VLDLDQLRFFEMVDGQAIGNKLLLDFVERLIAHGECVLVLDSDVLARLAVRPITR
jgi:hypothetical protein